MTSQRVVVIAGHPDTDRARFGHALAATYAQGVRDAGRQVRLITVADLDFPVLRSQADWKNGAVPKAIADAQAAIEWADHVAIFYPLWLGDVPALLKAFLEQVMRPGFALDYPDVGFPKKRLGGRSADIVVTMATPAFLYRTWFGAHSVRSLKRSILQFVGISPVRTTLIGNIEARQNARVRWLGRMHNLGNRDF